MKKLNKLSLWIGATMMAIPAIAFGAPIENIQSVGSITSVDALWSKVQEGLNWFLTVVIALGAVMIIWGGYQYMSGKPEDGRKTLTYGIIGVIVAAGAWTIITIVRKFVGV